MRMHRLLVASILTVVGVGSAAAQTATVTGQVVYADGGAPLAYTSVSVLPQPAQLLTNEGGTFQITGLVAGPVRLRFKRIGFAPKDTTFVLAENESARISVGLTRLVIKLPAVVVSGKCTDRTPFESKPAELADLFDQLNQNAERMKLLAAARPFLVQVIRSRGTRDRENRLLLAYRDTIMRRPLPPEPYQPKQVLRPGEGIDIGRWLIALPEAPDIADTAFTNNHCFQYAGQTRFEEDSVIAVTFEPVPWLDKEVDITGTLYLRLEDYQLVGSVTKLNRIPGQFRRGGLRDYTVRARFSEIVDGIPVLDKWELTNSYSTSRRPFVEVGQLFNVQWTDTTSAVRDSVRP
jgi:hypothetical protein